MGMILRSFEHIGIPMFRTVSKSIVRVHFLYNQTGWAPHKKHIKVIGYVLWRASKMVPGLRNLTYAGRVRKLNLPIMVCRRWRDDMIEVYKIKRQNTIQRSTQYFNLEMTWQGAAVWNHSKPCIIHSCDKIHSSSCESAIFLQNIADTPPSPSYHTRPHYNKLEHLIPWYLRLNGGYSGSSCSWGRSAEIATRHHKVR